MAILVVNNLRDRHTDVVAHKRTLAVRFGPKVARVEYALAVFVGLLLTVGVALTRAPLAVVGVLGMPMSLSLIQKVWTLDGAALNPLLGQTAKLLLVTTTLTALAMVLSR